MQTIGQTKPANGSIVAVTDASGTLISQQRYLPPVPRSGIRRRPRGRGKHFADRLRVHGSKKPGFWYWIDGLQGAFLFALS